MFKTSINRIFLFTFFIATLSCLFPIKISAHAQVDTLQQIWISDDYPDAVRFNAINQFFKNYINSKPDAVLETAGFHHQLATEKNAQEEIVNAINHKADALRILGKYDDALTALNNLVTISLDQKDTIALADSYYLIGKTYHYQSKYLDAVKYILKGLSLYQEKEMHKAQAKLFNTLGTVYYEINNLDLALETFDKGFRLAQELGHEEALNCITLNTGFVNYEKENYRKAIALSQKALTSFESTNHLVGVADCYYLIAQSHHALNQIDTALYFVRKSLDINLSIGNTGQIIPTKLLLANILLSEGSDDEARGIVEEILPNLNTSFGYAYLKDAHHLLYKCYKVKGLNSLALKMHEQYASFTDSLLIEEDNLALTRQALQSEYDIELLNRQLENEKIQSALKFDQLKRTFSIIFLSSLIVLCTLFYARSSALNQRNAKDSLLKEIKELKRKGNLPVQLVAPKFQLIRHKIEKSIGKKINETDWKVLNILLEDPVISNKDIAAKAYLTVDGIGSCLRRMYSAFELKESKYKKIALIMKAIKLSNIAADISVVEDQTTK